MEGGEMCRKQVSGKRGIPNCDDGTISTTGCGSENPEPVKALGRGRTSKAVRAPTLRGKSTISTVDERINEIRARYPTGALGVYNLEAKVLQAAAPESPSLLELTDGGDEDTIINVRQYLGGLKGSG